MKDGKRLVGVMDIGTNTARLMLAHTDGGIICDKRKYVTTTRIGRGLESTGVLADEAMERTARVLEDYVRLARKMGADEIYCFATNAVRSSRNSGDFVQMLYDMTGLRLHIISGEQEAMAGYTGATGGCSATLIDIGGGSTEVITGDEKGINYAKSLEMGVVRLLDRFGMFTALRRGEYFEYIRGVLRQLEGLKEVITPNLTGVSGTVTTAAAIRLGLEEYAPDRVQGQVLPVRYISELLEMLGRMDNEERKQVRGLSPQRADVICYGLSVLLCFMEMYGFEQITVSDSDNLEGYLQLKMQEYFDN